MKRPKYLYHGGRTRVDLLEPKQAVGFGKEADRQKAVYAVARREWAIPFALTFIPLSEGAVFSVDLRASPPRILLENTAVVWESSGYLYTLPSDTFQRIDDHQWVSYQAVRPVRVDAVKAEDYRHWIESVR